MAKQQPAKPANSDSNKGGNSKPGSAAGPAASQERKSELMVPDAAPDYIDGGGEGFENVRGKDIELPRLKLIQKGARESDVDGIAPGSITDTLSGEVIVGKDEEIEIVPALHYVSWIEWADIDDGGGIIDSSMDPKSTLAARANERDEDGKQVVTEYHNFIVLIPSLGLDKPYLLCLSKTSFKHGRRLLMLARNRKAKDRNGNPVGAPLFAGKYKMSTELVERNDLRWYETKFENAGWADADTFAAAKALHASLGESLRQGKVKFTPADEPSGEPAGEPSEGGDGAPDRSQEKDNY